MEFKVFRNKLLKGVIGIQNAVDLLGKRQEVITNYCLEDIIISRNNDGNVVIDLYDVENQKAVGGEFQEW